MDSREYVKMYREKYHADSLSLEELFTRYDVDWDAVDEKTKEKIEDDYDMYLDICDEDGRQKVSLYGYEVEDYGLWQNAGYTDNFSFDEEECETFIGNVMKDTDKYLVYAKNASWDGKDGYKFVNDMMDAFASSATGEAVQYVKDAAPDGKVLSFMESSRNVLNSPCVIIALDDSEYDKLKSAEFAEVKNYAEKTSAGLC